MSDCIWVSDTSQISLSDFGFFPDFNGGSDRDAEEEMSQDLRRRLSSGESIPKDQMPKKFYHSAANKFERTLPDFFITGVFFFKEPISSIFRVFDMGSGYFHPVQLVQWDRKTLVADDVSVLCIGNAKDTVMIEETKGIKHWYHDIYNLPLFAKDGQIVTRRSALGGPDLWCDPHIGKQKLFLSPRLADALIAAGHKKCMGLVPTTTV